MESPLVVQGGAPKARGQEWDARAVRLRAQRVTELLLELLVELIEGEALVLRARVLDLQRAHQVAHAADGQPVEVRGCDFFTFKNGKIAKKDSYWKIREVGS